MLWLLNLVALAFALLQGESDVTPASIEPVTAGNLKSALYGNQVKRSYDYNARHHLRRMRTVNSAQTLLANFDYDGAGSDASAVAGAWGDQSLSKSGRRNRMDENVNGTLRSVFYTYDQLNRLTKETIGGSEVVYDSAVGYADASGYDPVGNRRNRTVAGAAITQLPAQTLSYDANDQIDADANPENSNTLHDKNGNRLSGVGATYQYDYENRLIRAVLADRVVSIIYNGDGHRVQKTVTGTGASVTHYLVDDRNPTGYAQVIEERATAQSSTPSVTYIYGLDLVSQTRSGTTHYYGYDGLGTVRYLTDTDVTISDTYTYDAFGIGLPQSPSAPPNLTPNHYRYTGEQWDPDLGLYYLRARYYNPAEGRFLTLDTFEGSQNDPPSLHKYLYCHADPVNNIDPSGRFSVSEAYYSLGARLYLAAQTYQGIVTAGRIGLATLTLATFLAEPDFRGGFVSSLGGPGNAATFLAAEIRFAGVVGANVIRHGTTSPNVVNIRLNVGDSGDFRIKARNLQRAAQDGNLVVVSNPSNIRDASAQAAYRRAVLNRYVRVLQQSGMSEEQARSQAARKFSTLQADHKIDLQVSGALSDPNAVSNLQMLDGSVNTSVGSQLAREIERLGLQSGDLIHQVNVFGL